MQTFIYFILQTPAMTPHLLRCFECAGLRACRPRAIGQKQNDGERNLCFRRYDAVRSLGHGLAKGVRGREKKGWPGPDLWRMDTAESKKAKKRQMVCAGESWLVSYARRRVWADFLITAPDRWT